MRKSTEVWAKFQSIGHPESTKVFHISVQGAIVEMARWILTVKMGSRIEITFARTESELQTTAPKDPDDMVAMLESILANESDGGPNEAATSDTNTALVGDS